MDTSTLLKDLDALSYLISAENLARLLKNAVITIRNLQYELEMMQSKQQLASLEKKLDDEREVR